MGTPLGLQAVSVNSLRTAVLHCAALPAAAHSSAVYVAAPHALQVALMVGPQATPSEIQSAATMIRFIAQSPWRRVPHARRPTASVVEAEAG